ncbi:MAG: hypothetical protein AVDCRST_MAG50-784 [uncultured Acidimicrobiales bacterium]|uniref:Uncharacterized protein n=1 Tax=uncultured Acidimicrobiales bacterium TaxID=310071 RepID=A0A6J4HKI9_9ACTN|nr:MAG: hypothetical protein AVDCRST_MAG50-784 [uncultured Acidimicrobiales bacterium]
MTEMDSGDERTRTADEAKGAPGASAPGEQGYSGEATIGDVGAAAGPESFQEPFGRPDTSPDGEHAAAQFADPPAD